MCTLEETAPAFVEMAHSIVWASVASVGENGRLRSRILHPLGQWDGNSLVGWIATSPTPIKKAHLNHSPYLSINYWAPSQDTCVADCRATWALDDETRTQIWHLFLNTPEPVGYDPSIIPAWENPTVDAIAILKVEPWHIRVFPGSVLYGKGGNIFNWYEQEEG